MKIKVLIIYDKTVDIESINKELEANPLEAEVIRINKDNPTHEEACLINKYNDRPHPVILLVNDDELLGSYNITHVSGKELNSLIRYSYHKDSGRFVVIEDFCDNISLVTDSSGEVMVFDSMSDAKAEARKCQNGKIVEL